MRFTELIRDDLVKIGLEATSKWEAIEELVDLLISAHELRYSDRDKVIEAVFTRERSLSTGLEHGLAVPHGVSACVDDVVAAFATCPDGIPFESLDGRPTRLIVLLVIPEGRFQRHVRTLASIAGLARDPGLREQLLAARDSVELVELLYEAETREELTD